MYIAIQTSLRLSVHRDHLGLQRGGALWEPWACLPFLEYNVDLWHVDTIPQCTLSRKKLWLLRERDCSRCHFLVQDNVEPVDTLGCKRAGTCPGEAQRRGCYVPPNRDCHRRS